MLEIKGKYAEAKIFSSFIEDAAENQIREVCDMPFAEGSKIRIMPDVHAGVGCTIGTTMTISDRAVPNMVGVDIGCGMETVILKNSRMEFEKLDKLIQTEIPSAMNIRKIPHERSRELDLISLRCAKHVNLERALKSVGTLGGGNHFIEVDRDDEGTLYLVIHSGSRHLGTEVADYYQQEGIKYLKAKGEDGVPPQLAYVEGELFDDYIHDMKIVQNYAELNRETMADIIMRGMKLKAAGRFSTIHNYIDTDSMILRKGAVSAKKGEQLLIPINMRDGSLLCIGKGNTDWNSSAPHGAGRLMSRTDARKSFTLSEFKSEMRGVFTTSVRRDTLDECPMAYKNAEDIINNINPTADIIKMLKPLYNFKAGS